MLKSELEQPLVETYFEYERKDGSRFLSIIAWDEWDLDKYGLEFIQTVKYRYEKKRVWK